VLAGACGPAVAPVVVPALPPARAVAPTPVVRAPAEPIRDPAGLQESLDAIAVAFLAADPDQLEPWLHDPESQFGRRWLDRARYLSDVPLASYRLVLDESLPDLATDQIRRAYGTDVQVVYVVEELQLEGFDERPAAEDLFLTLVADPTGWRAASDRDAERHGLVSVDHLWDHGPVVATTVGPVMALHHPDGPPVGPLLEEASAGLAEARERWPLAWPERVPIIVPRDEDELAELLHVTFDLSNFIAFATSTSIGHLDTYELTGSRIVLNPGRFLDRDSATRQRILVHELMHVATRPVSGPMLPSWLDEGIAQALGEQQSTTGTRLLDALATADVRLPTDGEFVVGGRDRIFLSYQLAWSFVEHLRATYGSDAVAAFYAAAGRGAVGQPGTEEYHVDRAAREAFGAPLADLIETWRAGR
jgi:hypothetical protein